MYKNEFSANTNHHHGTGNDFKLYAAKNMRAVFSVRVWPKLSGIHIAIAAIARVMYAIFVGSDDGVKNPSSCKRTMAHDVIATMIAVNGASNFL